MITVDHYNYQLHPPDTIGNGNGAPKYFHSIQFPNTIREYDVFRAIKLATSLVFETCNERLSSSTFAQNGVATVSFGRAELLRLV